MVVTSTKRTLGAALFLIVAVVTACERGGERPGALTAITGAPAPRPDTTVPTTRTIDNAGFVDNAGHTTDETVRSEFSGMRATEAGSERITGTPGYGVPLPIEPKIPRRSGEATGASGETAPAGGPATTTAEVDEAIARVARARCDRETTCNRVGPSHRWGSTSSCLVQERMHTRQEMSHYACGRGVDMVPLGTCLATIRALRCEVGSVALDSTPECVEGALCSGP
jgi:hypothetical protein